MTIGKKKLTKRSISALETKNKIYNIALKLFAKHGYETVTIEDIAKYAKISKGNFYTHFDSKDSVLLELFNRIDSYYVEVFKHVSDNETAENQIRILLGAMCEYCKNVCGIKAIQVIYANQVSSKPHTKILNNKARAIYTFLRKIIVLGQSNGEFQSDVNPDYLAEIVARFFRALLYDWCLYNDDFDLQTEGDRYFDFIVKAIKKR